MPDLGSLLCAPVPPMTLHLFSYLAFIALLCFFGVKQKTVFETQSLTLKTETIIDEVDATESIEVAVNTATSNNESVDKNEKAITEIIEKMQHHMNQDKPYLDPDFTVYHLAEVLGPVDLSSLILQRFVGFLYKAEPM